MSTMSLQIDASQISSAHWKSDSCTTTASPGKVTWNEVNADRTAPIKTRRKNFGKYHYSKQHLKFYNLRTTKYRINSRNGGCFNSREKTNHAVQCIQLEMTIYLLLLVVHNRTDVFNTGIRDAKEFLQKSTKSSKNNRITP